MTDYSLNSYHGLFFYYFELKKISVQSNKEKKSLNLLNLEGFLSLLKHLD